MTIEVPPGGAANQPGDDAARVDLLHELLRDRDVPCPLCEYNLRNLTGERCPECGSTLALNVGLTEPRLGTYLVLLVACCVGLGGSALFAALAAAQAPARWWRHADAGILLFQLALTSILLPIILARRSRFRRASPSRQRWLATAMCLVVALLWALFVRKFKG